MRQAYEVPQIEVTYFGTLDILTDSLNNNAGDGENSFTLPGAGGSIDP
ncbi:MAG: hypothetical protein LBR68_02800 [Lachnoclostridium sp.]|jgi:hypothetical protein|nr:hypothetical protein [Lachnoclostridium sp.]